MESPAPTAVVNPLTFPLLSCRPHLPVGLLPTSSASFSLSPTQSPTLPPCWAPPELADLPLPFPCSVANLTSLIGPTRPHSPFPLHSRQPRLPTGPLPTSPTFLSLSPAQPPTPPPCCPPLPAPPSTLCPFPCSTATLASLLGSSRPLQPPSPFPLLNRRPNLPIGPRLTSPTSLSLSLARPLTSPPRWAPSDLNSLSLSATQPPTPPPCCPPLPAMPTSPSLSPAQPPIPPLYQPPLSNPNHHPRWSKIHPSPSLSVHRGSRNVNERQSP